MQLFRLAHGDIHFIYWYFEVIKAKNVNHMENNQLKIDTAWTLKGARRCETSIETFLY